MQALHNVTTLTRATTVSAFQTLSYISEGCIFIYLGLDTLDPIKWQVCRVLHGPTRYSLRSHGCGVLCLQRLQHPSGLLQNPETSRQLCDRSHCTIPSRWQPHSLCGKHAYRSAA
jgi:hypothetical protein